MNDTSRVHRGERLAGPWRVSRFAVAVLLLALIVAIGTAALLSLLVQLNQYHLHKNADTKRAAAIDQWGCFAA